MAELRVRDLMSEAPFALDTEASLYQLREMLAEKRIRHVPIVDGDGELVGLISERDLIRTAMAPTADFPVSMQGDVMRSSTVADIMIQDVETVEPDEPIAVVAHTMLENKFGCLPVVESGRLVGILTESDFVRHLAGG